MSSDRKLRTLHISTTVSGGAGIAARQLNLALNLAGFRSFFLSKASLDFTPSAFEYDVGFGTWQKGKAKAATLVNLALGEPFFSLVDASLSKKQLVSIVQHFDIIHLHNFYNLITLDETFVSAVENRPVIVTLHDSRFFTGGCHLHLQCRNFRQCCQSCPRVPSLFKQLVRTNASEILELAKKVDLVVISPSKWLLHQFRQSSVGHVVESIQIENVLVKPSNFVLKKLFDGSKTVVGFASELNAILKGSIIVEKIRDFIEKTLLPMDVVIPSQFSYNMEIFWDAIDVLVVPSLAENHPNVVTEAHLRGIPVVAVPVGGIPEMLYEDFDSLMPRLECSPSAWIEMIAATAIKYNFTVALEISRIVTLRVQKAMENHVALYSQTTRPI